MTIKSALAALLLCTVAAGPLMAADGGVKAVTLSSGGLAEVTRVHEVDGNGVIRMEAPASQVDDLLKSLVVRDPKGTVGSVSLDGPDQAEETFRRMPFKPDDLASPARLVGTLQGVPVRVESGGRTVTGKALGVSERSAGTEKGMVRVLSVLKDDGAVDTLALEDGATVSILDPDMAKKVAEAAAAAGKARADGARAVEIKVSGTGRRDVGVSYVVAAPVWKTAYRVVDGGEGKARIQAWAVIENATGEDWEKVAVTLSSGSPVTLRQRLHQRYWRERPEVPVDVEGASVPEVDRGAQAPRAAKAYRGGAQALAMPAPMSRAAGASADMMAESAASMAEPSAAAETAEATEGDVSASYRLPSPVDLAAGRTLSVPIVDAEVEAKRVSFFKPGRGVHPVAALMIRNGSEATLPPGIITVYDTKSGYVGDARLPSTPAGERRMASFATDRKVEVTSDSAGDESLAGLTVVDGVAKARLVSREVTSYSVKGAPDSPRTVIVEHPKREGRKVASDALDGETPTAWRLKVEVPAGKTVAASVTLETVRSESFSLADADEAMVAQWASTATDPKVAAKLAELSRARAEAASAEREISDLGEAEERVKEEQARVRSNLQAVPRDSELARTYLQTMGDQERELAVSAKARRDAELRLRKLQDGVRAVVRTF